MSGSYPPPPAYDDVKSAVASQSSNPNWQKWFRQLTTLEFNQDEATEYARLFVTNDVEFSMIPELNDGILKTIGIEKAGHRIRILRLQNKATTRPSAPAQVRKPSEMTVPRCAWHPNVAANEKCRKCNRLMCLACRREKPGDGGTRYFCQDCHDDCTIL